MLGKTAGSLFWMFRYLERAETMARLLDAGFRISLTDADSAGDEWESVLRAADALEPYKVEYDRIETEHVVDFLLRSKNYSSSVYSCFKAARENGRSARTALTRDTWEAINQSWIRLNSDLKGSVHMTEFPALLSQIRQYCALVRGAMEGTMMRNDGYDFAKLGKFVERADSTSRLLNVKYYLLLPSADMIGGPVDNVQWERVLRCVSAERAFHQLYPGNISAQNVVDFLILDRRMPRSLAFCTRELTHTMDYLRRAYTSSPVAYEQAYDLRALIEDVNTNQIFKIGLYEFITNFTNATAAFAAQVETDYRFYK